MIEMLEEYSKGKVLTIQTQKKKKVKKVRQQGQNEDEDDGDFDPNEGEKERDVMDDDDSLAEESDDDHEEKFVERSFNFVSEISIFVDYAIISKYLYIIRDKDYMKNPLLLQAVLTLFKRIMNQIKAGWIFFQFEYLLIFEKVLNDGHVNNHLMRGINLNAPLTTRERQIEGLKTDFK